MPKDLISPRLSLKLPTVAEETATFHGGIGIFDMKPADGPAALRLPPMEGPQALSLTTNSTLYAQLYKGHLYKSQLGNSLPDLASKLQRQRSRMPCQFEKISFKVHAADADQSRSRIAHLPTLTPRTPVVIESRTGPAKSALAKSACLDSHVLEIHADTLDLTFEQHAKPGARPPWKPDCFCPRCGFMREQWVEQNKKPFRPFSRQREPTITALYSARKKSIPSLQQQEKHRHQHQQEGDATSTAVDPSTAVDTGGNVNPGPGVEPEVPQTREEAIPSDTEPRPEDPQEQQEDTEPEKEPQLSND